MKATHRRFAHEYAVDLDGAKAAIRAGYSKKGASVAANKLLKREDVQAEVKRLVEARAEKVGLKLERVLEELACMAFVNPKDFYDEKGNLLPIPKLADAAARALAGFDVEQLVTKRCVVSKVRYDKRAALVALLEHLAPVKRFELTGKNGQALVPPSPRLDLSKVPTAVLEKFIAKVAKS